MTFSNFDWFKFLMIMLGIIITIAIVFGIIDRITRLEKTVCVQSHVVPDTCVVMQYCGENCYMPVMVDCSETVCDKQIHCRRKTRHDPWYQD